MLEKNNNKAFVILRLTFGILPIVAGLDKFFNLLVRWEAYLAPWLAAALPSGIMKIAAIFEIIIGILILNKATTKIGARLVFAWLLAIALQVMALGIYDIALRDLALAFGALALIQLEKLQSRS